MPRMVLNVGERGEQYAARSKMSPLIDMIKPPTYLRGRSDFLSRKTPNALVW